MGLSLLQSDWCTSRKKRGGLRHTESKDRVKTAVHKSQRGPAAIVCAGTLTLDFQPPKLRDSWVLLCKSLAL